MLGAKRQHQFTYEASRKELPKMNIGDSPIMKERKTGSLTGRTFKQSIEETTETI